MKSLRWLLCLLPMLTFACGQRDLNQPDDDTLGVAPKVDSSTIITSGGAATPAGRSAGGGGSITLTVQGGRLREDTFAAFPPVSLPFLTNAELDGGVVTYTELEALQTPVIAGPVATFTVTGAEFFIDPQVTLDLSDTPTGVDTVAIVSDAQIRLDGLVRTRRAGDNAVSLSLTTSAGAAVRVAGLVDTSAAATFDGGGVMIDSDGEVWLRGWIDTRGGAADATTDAGAGGSVQIAAMADAYLRRGSLVTRGGAGDAAGGSAGGVAIDVSGGSGGAFDWGIDARGGAGGTGAGGAGGTVTVSLPGMTDWFQLTLTSGGASATGTGGSAGAVTMVSPFFGGQLQVTAEGGASPAAAAGNGGAILLAGSQFEVFSIRALARGGTGDAGGAGGTLTVQAATSVRDTLLDATLDGGDAVNAAGSGGRLSLQGSGAGLWVDGVDMWCLARGGNGANSGNGGILEIDGNTFGASISTANLFLSGDVPGGTGPLGGTGGQVRVTAPGGSVIAFLEAFVSAGESTGGPGVPGGVASVELGDGDIDVTLNVSAFGGAATGFAGGDGGSVVINGASLAAAGGASRVRGAVFATGGPSDLGGGTGGSVLLRAGNGGTVETQDLRIELNGGDSSGDNGGPGGAFTVATEGPAFLVGSSVEVVGGAGSSAAGTGLGGDGGTITISTAQGSAYAGTRLLADGGAGRGAGGTGGTIMMITDTDLAGNAGDIIVAANAMARGGPGIGTGTGGDGGTVTLNATAAAGGGYDGSIHMVLGSIIATGGAGATGGDGGSVSLLTQGAEVRIGTTINTGAGVGGGDGGTITVGAGADLPVSVLVAFTARLASNGTGTGLAGFIMLDPVGAAPNPALLVEAGALLQTLDGDGTDREATNQTLD